MDTLPLQTTGEPSEATVPDTKKRLAVFFIEFVQVVLISMAIILPVRYFLIKPFYVKGESMEPNFFEHEYLIIDELGYRFHEPQRGDVVVFKHPNNKDEALIKRVIGMPGETVEISDGKIRLYNTEQPNGIVLEEAYLNQEFTSASVAVTLKPGEYFMLGDNREKSLDSRYFGPVDRSLVIGRVWLRGFPFDRWKRFESITYPF